MFDAYPISCPPGEMFTRYGMYPEVEDDEKESQQEEEDDDAAAFWPCRCGRCMSCLGFGYYDF